jgi:uncharacterized protein (DUF1330 family)
MGADGDRHVTLFGLEVTDDAGYAQYRNAMAPILARHGGAFGCDFVVAQVLKGPNPRINRVFTLTFPSRAHRDRFFADQEYRAVRARWFAPSVGAVEVLAETSRDVARPTWVGVSDAGVVASMSPSPKTRAETFCARHGLRVPLLLAPMAGACPPELSIAVARGGGMGAMGARRHDEPGNLAKRSKSDLASPLPPACAGQRSE